MDVRGDVKWKIVKAYSKFHCFRLLFQRHFHLCKFISWYDICDRLSLISQPKYVNEQKWLYFFEQIHAQLSIGKNLLNALKGLPLKNLENVQKQFVKQAIDRLSNGYYMYPLLTNPQLNLTQQQARLLQCAEVGGYLMRGLERMKTMLELQCKIQKQMQQSLIYPACVLTIAFIFFCIMSLFLVPKFETFFAQQNLSMNHFMQTLLWLNHKAPAFILTIISLISIFTLFLKLKKLSIISYVERIFEHFCVQFKYSLFAMDLAELLDNKIHLLESLRLACNVLPKNFSYTRISLALHSGLPLSKAMHGLPEEFIQSLQTAEVNGRLTKILREVSKMYYKSYENKLLQWTRWIEPCSLMAIAFFIFISVILLFYPLLQVFQSLDLSL